MGLNVATQGKCSGTKLLYARGTATSMLLFFIYFLSSNKRLHKHGLDFTLRFSFQCFFLDSIGNLTHSVHFKGYDLNEFTWYLPPLWFHPQALSLWSPVLHPNCFPVPPLSKLTGFLSLIGTTGTISEVVISDENPTVTPWGSLLTLSQQTYNPEISLTSHRAFGIFPEPHTIMQPLRMFL